LEDAVLPSKRRAPRLALILVALGLAPIAAAASGAATGDSGTPPAATVELVDEGPRNPEAEAATGDIDAMRAVVQEIVDCLRAKGFHTGDPEVSGDSVLIGGWNPEWDSAAGRATEECSFPTR